MQIKRKSQILQIPSIDAFATYLRCMNIGHKKKTKQDFYEVTCRIDWQLGKLVLFLWQVRSSY